eukprot:80795-Amphidinium_carterae.3
MTPLTRMHRSDAKTAVKRLGELKAMWQEIASRELCSKCLNISQRRGHKYAQKASEIAVGTFKESALNRRRPHLLRQRPSCSRSSASSSTKAQKRFHTS